MYAKYGAMPQEVYTGLHYGTNKNKFAEMQAILKGMLDAVISNPNGKLTPSWKKAYNDVLDAYLAQFLTNSNGTTRPTRQNHLRQSALAYILKIT